MRRSHRRIGSKAADENLQGRSRWLQITTEIRCRNGEQRERPKQLPREIPGAPKLERADGRDQNVKHKRSWTNDNGRDSKQRHRCDVTRRTSMTDRRVK